MTIKILIADDSKIISDGMAYWLDEFSGMEIVGIAVDGLDAVEKANEFHPDVVIMDVQMPNMDGLEATKRIKNAMPEVEIIFLSAFADHMECCAEAGGSAYMLKDCDPDDLAQKIMEVFTASSRG